MALMPIAGLGERAEMTESGGLRTLGGSGLSGTRITIVLSSLGAGGTEHVASLIANHWVGLGCAVTLVTLEPPNAEPYYALHPRVSVERLNLPPRKCSKLRAGWLVFERILRLRAAIGRSRPDTVLSFLTRMNVLTLLATAGLAVPVIVSERNNPALQPVGSAWQWLRRRLYPHAFGLVTMTNGALEQFQRKMRRRAWVVANAVDLPAGWRKRRGNNILAAVGRLTPQKGFDLLLEAFARIADRHPEWTLVIWGEGEDRQLLEAQRDALGLRHRVEMPGVTARPGLWVETADVFVLSSRYEGWGIALTEAMAAGLPVVSFDCEWGPSEMVHHGEDGILVPGNDVDALASALSKVLSDGALRERLGINAAASAMRYAPERILPEWDAVAASALDRSESAETSISSARPARRRAAVSTCPASEPGVPPRQ